MKKKAQIALKPIIEMLIAVAIFFLFLSIGKAYGSGEIYQKIRLSREISISADALYSIAPDYAVSVVSKDISDFLIDVNGNKVKVSSYKNDDLSGNYYFVKTTNSGYDVSLENPKQMLLTKKGQYLFFDRAEFLKSKKYTCPNIQIKKPSKIILIPRTKEEKEYMFTKALLEIKNSETKDNINDVSSDSNIIIEVVPSSLKNTIKIIINPTLESKKLACLILNNIIEADKTINTEITYSNKPVSAYIYLSLEMSREFEDSQAIIKAILDAFKSEAFDEIQ